MPPIQLGDLQLLPLTDGTFRLDGGAMFGIVPRTIWERTNPPDDKNRILLGLRPLLVVAPDRKIVIDAGMGSKWDAKARDIFDLRQPPDLVRSLAEHGLAPEDIDAVLLTHLHIDHAGGSTMRAGSGAIVPTFPRADYYVQAAEWEAATHPNERTRGSYRAEDFLPLKDSGRLRFVDGDVEILPGIQIVRTGGHIRDHCIFLIRGGGRTAVFWADLVPTTTHLRPAYIMGYDLYPMETLAQKKRYIPQAIQEQWICFFEHDPVVAAGILRGDPDKPTVETLA